MDIIGRQIKKLEQMYLRAYTMGITNGNLATFQDPEKLQEFKSEYAKLCEIEHNHEELRKIVNNFKPDDFDTFDEEYKAANAAFKKFNPDTCEKIKAFENELDALFNSTQGTGQQKQGTCTVVDEDGDFEMATEELDFTDPISKKQITDPVRNQTCNHLYEKSSIEEAIKLNARTRCPYIGCKNKNYIKISDLKEDRELKRKLELRFMRMENEDQLL